MANFNLFQALFAVPDTMETEQYRGFAILTVAGVLGFVAHAVFFILFILFEVHLMAYFNIVSCIIFALVFAGRKRGGRYISMLMLLAIAEIALHAVVAVVLIGWDSNFHYYLYLAIVSSFFVHHFSKNLVYVINTIALTAYIGLLIYTFDHLPVQEIPLKAIRIFSLLNLISASFMVIIVMAYYDYVASKAVGRYKSSKNALVARSDELEVQTSKLSLANKKVVDSIRYALRIQSSILPLSTDLDAMFGKGNVMKLYLPKDIVSGDFFWCEKVNGKKILFLGDCTGHGVPGAMLTMAGERLLNSIVSEEKITDPAEILNALTIRLSSMLARGEYHVRDGMDAAICTIDESQKKLYFSGAKLPLNYIQEGQLFEIRGDRRSVGKSKMSEERKRQVFTTRTIDLSKSTTFYLYSDGYQDQLGGDNDDRFMSKRLKEILLDNYQKLSSEQEKVYLKELKEWQGENRQTDDITLLGVKIEL